MAVFLGSFKKENERNLSRFGRSEKNGSRKELKKEA